MRNEGRDLRKENWGLRTTISSHYKETRCLQASHHAQWVRCLHGLRPLLYEVRRRAPYMSLPSFLPCRDFLESWVSLCLLFTTIPDWREGTWDPDCCNGMPFSVLPRISRKRFDFRSMVSWFVTFYYINRKIGFYVNMMEKDFFMMYRQEIDRRSR